MVCMTCGFSHFDDVTAYRSGENLYVMCPTCVEDLFKYFSDSFVCKLPVRSALYEFVSVGNECRAKQILCRIVKYGSGSFNNTRKAVISAMNTYSSLQEIGIRALDVLDREDSVGG